MRLSIRFFVCKKNSLDLYLSQNLGQNILSKNIKGFKYFTLIELLLNKLKINQIEKLYLKHKIFGLRLIYL